MKRRNEYLIDRRSEEDLRRQIKQLSISYTPEWAFDTENPDVGSVIALIFAGQMAESIRKINQLPEKYRTEFVNLLNISLLPAYPARGVVVMELIRNTVPGIDVAKGTKLLGATASDEGENVIFETLHDAHITNSRLVDIVATSGHFGRIIPLMGEARRADILGNAPPTIAEEEPNDTAPEILLFDYSAQGVEQNAFLMYHQSVFDTASGVDISVRVSDAVTGESLAGALADPQLYRWSYYGDEGFTPFDGVREEGGALVLSKSGVNKKVMLGEESYSLMMAQALTPVREDMTLGTLQVSSACGECAPTFIMHNDQEEDSGRAMPFGDTASLFDECYIGHDDILRQYGATVTMRFKLSYVDKLVALTPVQEVENLKVIKRKPRAVLFDTASTVVERVSIEYFNGYGWRRLDCESDWSTMFDGSREGDFTITFRCPDDIRPVVQGGFSARALRIRVTQADNCYLRPCIHKMPVLENLTLSYSYFGEWRMPQRLRAVCGTQITDLTKPMLDGRPITVLRPLPYSGNALYLGFDRKMEGTPVSMLFDVEESVHFISAPITFEYSTLKGFAPLKAVDHTDNMSAEGTIMFLPQTDFAEVEIAGVRRYWIRIADETGAFDDPDRYHTRIKRILMNAVEVHNVQTMEEEAFYIDASLPNMSFQLAASNILSTELFVNERPRLSLPVMKRMMEETPDDVRAEYDFIGNISEFFVRWREVENFDNSTAADRHYRVDRMTNTIHFGDGANVMIPPASAGVAFTVTALCCDGAKANLPPGYINNPYGQLLFIDSIYNPISTYSGCDLETVESAHLRGANLLNSRGRLLSEQDFVRETLAFSGAVDKAKCVVGRDIDGNADDRFVSIAVLMKDYADGSYSFQSIRERLEQRLTEKSELTLTRDCLFIAEPVKVELSVDVWVHTESSDRFIDIQNTIKQELADYIDPLSGSWDIGLLPTESQIGIMLHSIKLPARIACFIVTARYSDQHGVHERDLGTLPLSPFMMGVNGRHTVHILD